MRDLMSKTLLLLIALVLPFASSGQTTAFDALASEYYYDYRPSVFQLQGDIDRGADVDARGPNGQSPLMIAIWKATAEHVSILLDAGADVSLVDEGGSTAFHAAVSNVTESNEKLLALLKTNKADSALLNLRTTRYGQTALMLAVISKNSSNIEALLEAGADPSLRDKEGTSPSEVALGQGNKDLAYQLEPRLRPTPPSANVTNNATKPRVNSAATLLLIPDYPQVARDIASGKPFDFDNVSQSVTAGVATTILQDCKIDMSAADRLELADFVKTAIIAASVGMDYSNPDVTAAWSSQQKNLAQYTAGAAAAAQMGCVGDAPSKIAAYILETVRFNRKGQSGKAVFLESCSVRHGETKCSCLLSQGMTIDSNLADRQYSKATMDSVFQRNPFVGLVIISQCGLSEY